MSKRIKWLFILLVVLGLLLGTAYFIWTHVNMEKDYTGYTVLGSTDRADSKSASYARYGDGFVRYSRDGIAYYSADNIPQWNAAYELQSPVLDVRGDYCAVAGVGGSKIYVFNKNGAVMSVDTALSIITISVSAKGYVAAILEDSNSQYIDMYDTAGDKVYHIKTSIQGNGIPTDISISDDGAKLIVAYATVEGNQVNTSVAFYNFGEVGKNEAERLVGGYDQYEGMLVPMVEFVNSGTAVAFATGKVSIYTISQYPKLIADIVPQEEIHGVFYSGEYLGLVFANHDSGHPYVIEVYDLKGTMLLSYEIEKNYKEYCFVGTNILMYDDNDAYLVSLEGRQRFGYSFSTAIDSLIPVSGDNVYVYITSRKVQKIELQ